jgi:Glyoxalase-like domain
MRATASVVAQAAVNGRDGPPWWSANLLDRRLARFPAGAFPFLTEEARAMALTWTTLVVDCVDPGPAARFWAAAFGAPEPKLDEDGALVVSLPNGQPELLFSALPEAKTVKNRLHIDVTPETPGGQEAEVTRLIALGATHAQVGQTASESWVVLADPAGNEFCVLRGGD